MTSTQTLKANAMLFRTDNDTITYTVFRDVHGAYLTEGELFLIESAVGEIYMARFTGRTCQRYGLNCPTVERYEIETVADKNGVLFGARGAKVAGTLAVRPDYTNA